LVFKLNLTQTIQFYRQTLQIFPSDMYEIRTITLRIHVITWIRTRIHVITWILLILGCLTAGLYKVPFNDRLEIKLSPIKLLIRILNC